MIDFCYSQMDDKITSRSMYSKLPPMNEYIYSALSPWARSWARITPPPSVRLRARWKRIRWISSRRSRHGTSSSAPCAGFTEGYPQSEVLQAKPRLSGILSAHRRHRMRGIADGNLSGTGGSVINIQNWTIRFPINISAIASAATRPSALSKATCLGQRASC